MSNPDPKVAKDDEEEEGIKFDIIKSSALDCHETTPTSSLFPTKREGEEEEMKVASARNEAKEKKKEELGAGDVNDDDNDGFKTPTSLEHKIPEPKKCPPAPRRRRPLKRKPSPTRRSNAALEVRIRNLLQLQLDVSKQVKKARTQENQ
ncbi:hypothetical protein F3Y22_tig00110410pilonHSYRG00116 [Hibiscus syriacus]|uniref:Uncharacterized protein n=1 Tax=Hibiscus syriacus TaxID=106335 RepID=A0A6A3ASE0_HIBSY|nr:cyclin-dependent protein kinase inhibitor SMR3-like [Hibiscus syriacus]KAE8706025.1 hypothetical protein F3Y22_tig00110410pilonHSYRG00116 [Hibiscus syriacus]